MLGLLPSMHSVHEGPFNALVERQYIIWNNKTCKSVQRGPMSKLKSCSCLLTLASTQWGMSRSRLVTWGVVIAVLGRGSSKSHVLTTVYRTLAIRFARLAIQLSIDHDLTFQSLYCDMQIDRGPCFHQDLQTAFLNRVCGRMTDCCIWLRLMVMLLLTLMEKGHLAELWHILISGVLCHIIHWGTVPMSKLNTISR